MQCRIYLDVNFAPESLVDIGFEQTRYLRQVMRLQAGDTIVVFNGRGGEYLAELMRLSKDGGQCQLVEFIDVHRELPCRVHIIQAANRSEKIETVLQKATEMGASSFQIVNSERATLNLPSNKRDKRLQRWQKIIVEAAEQSERTAMPEVVWHDKVSQTSHHGQCFVLHPRDASMWQDIRSDLLQQKDITLAVGPEGGWTNQELDYFQSQGFQPLCFGARVMRTETAAPALLAAIQAVL
ncbi:16S rRNA (uracil(1498)-N(3))-methyltransferase [Ghiorsea bivora]|uniref:16S rRNA (uracil(1498)-N(3))-methyltransferase n=1 Tax=Ghiorsea bivora TaxID=1485545 RepID=UPI00056F7E6F|nr:16S rRNA (uracil(1498)-N(3))-methyltransferase [Ghiorsea bivora]